MKDLIFHNVTRNKAKINDLKNDKKSTDLTRICITKKISNGRHYNFSIMQQFSSSRNLCIPLFLGLFVLNFNFQGGDLHMTLSA